jgi:hypothetical protein
MRETARSMVAISLVKLFSGCSAASAVEPESILGEILFKQCHGFPDRSRQLADLGVVKERLSEGVDVGELLGDGPCVDGRQTAK